MKDSAKISLKAYLALLTLGLMPPLLKLIPSNEAAIAGTAGWLAPLVLFAPMTAGIWLIGRMGRSLPISAGLGEALCLWLGQGLGRLLCGIYGGWFLFTAAIALRFTAERFVSTIYPETGLGLFFLVILALEWYLGRRKLAVTARSAQIFFYLVLATLVVVLALGMGSVKSYHIAPVWWEDAPNVAKASLPLLGAVSVGAGWLFLFGEVAERKEGVRRAALWAAGMAAVMLLLGFVVMGAFGEAMVMRLQIPFFSLAKEVQIGNAVQRVEPLVVTMWVFADVISVALLLRSSERAFQLAFGTEGSLNSVLLLPVLPGAYLCAGSFFTLDRLYEKVYTPGAVVLFLLVPVLAFVIGKCRKIPRK